MGARGIRPKDHVVLLLSSLCSCLLQTTRRVSAAVLKYFKQLEDSTKKQVGGAGRFGLQWQALEFFAHCVRSIRPSNPT